MASRQCSCPRSVRTGDVGDACYLLPDDRRAAVFEGLRAQVGLNAGAIWKADQNTLLALAKMGGMRPETRVFRWREIARITMTQFEGDLDRILQEPYAKAKKALKQFPNIGDPGAEKILMLCGIGSDFRSNGTAAACYLRRVRPSTEELRGSVSLGAGGLERTA